MVPVWMTYSDLFKVTIIQCQLTWKWYNIQLYLQCPTNRKSYIVYQTEPFSITLNHTYPKFQCHAILWRWLSQKRYDIHSLNQSHILVCIYGSGFNEILIGTCTHYSTVSFWMILSDLAKFSDTKHRMVSIWASCHIGLHMGLPYIQVLHRPVLF